MNISDSKNRSYIELQTKITNPELYKNGLTPYPVVETLEEWLDDEVSKVKNRSIRWLSSMYFHRQEPRAKYIDNSYFFTPADGVITNINEKIDANAPLVEVKGVKFSLNDLLQDEVQGDWMVITIFMTFCSRCYASCRHFLYPRPKIVSVRIYRNCQFRYGLFGFAFVKILVANRAFVMRLHTRLFAGRLLLWH